MFPVTDSPFANLAPTAVVKLGGSLLDLPQLTQRLDQLRSDWGPRPLLVVGGGAAADLVRGWDQRHDLGEERAHWLALDALELTARLLESLWEGASLTRIEDIASKWRALRVPLVPARAWFELARAEGAPTPPHTWETTTDTIAAWIATVTHAQTLWLLKSVPCPATLAAAAEMELVDPQFARWAPAGVPIQWINLRDTADRPAVCTLERAD